MAQSIAFRVFALPAIVACIGFPGLAQRGNVRQKANSNANTATHVSAEMTRGKLNPDESRPGDQVLLKLKEDVKSNGQVILRKGTPITGVVRSVRTVEGNGETSGRAVSMMELEWLAPAGPGQASRQLMIALQSVSQVRPLSQGELTEESSGGLGVITNGSAASKTVHVNGQSNAALISMPSVVAVDDQTTSTLQNTFGIQSSGDPLLRVGRGAVISAGGLKRSVDIFSHLSNDTVLTSQSRNFEISSGAQMQLLVGVGKNQPGEHK